MRASRMLVSAACCMLLVACASSGTGGPSRSGTTITEQELEDPVLAGLTAYDAIQRLRPNWLRERGSSSIRDSGDNFPRAIVNDVPQSLDYLKSVSVPEVMLMQFISAADATTKYGTGFPNGAVMVSTVRRPD